MSEQLNRPRWTGGQDGYNREFKLLQSFPFSAEESAALCGDLKGLVRIFDWTFAPGLLVWTRQNRLGRPVELKQRTDMVAAIRGRPDGTAMMWELMAIWRHLNALGRAFVAERGAWTRRAARRLGEWDADRKYSLLCYKQLSCVRRLRRIPPDIVATQLEPVIEASNRSEGPLGDSAVKVKVHYQWIEMSSKGSYEDNGTLGKPSAQPSETQPASYQATLGIDLSGCLGKIDSFQEDTVSLLSNFRLPPEVRGDFVDRWNRERCRQGSQSLFKEVCTLSSQ
jgi:hypothetical protein